MPVVLILSRVNEKRKIFTRWLCIGYALVAAAAVFLTPNRYLMGVDRAELPQYRFAAIIRETPDATLLNFDFLDGGFYTTTGIVPNCRAFCALNIPLPELRGQQIDFLRDGVCDYVVTRNEELKGIDLEKYALADSCEYVLEGKMWTYRLYRRTASAVDSGQ